MTNTPLAELPAPPTTAPLEPALRARGLTKVHGTGDTAVTALDAVSVDIAAGRFTAVMGPSGSGKSTLMHLLAGLDTPTEGTVTLGDTRLDTLGDSQLTRLRRDRIGFVFQSFNLLPTLTARENIVLPLRLAGQRTDDPWIDEVIDAVGLRDRLGHRPAELSGGQRQRVAIARALATRPDVLAFLSRAVRELGQTVVMVTHDPVAAAWADTVLFLADGRLVDRITNPTADQVLDRMKAFGEVTA